MLHLSAISSSQNAPVSFVWSFSLHLLHDRHVIYTKYSYIEYANVNLHTKN